MGKLKFRDKYNFKTNAIQVRQGVVTLGSEPRMFTSNMTALSYLPPKDKCKLDPEISKGT